MAKSTRAERSTPRVTPSPPLSSSERWSGVTLYAIGAAVAEGLGREILSRQGALLSVSDPATRLGVETALALVPAALAHRALLRHVARPAWSALALLAVAFGIGEGVTEQVLLVFDGPLLMGLASGAVVGVAMTGVLDRLSALAQLAVVVSAAAGMAARTLVWGALGTREIVGYVLGLLALWVPIAALAYFAPRRVEERRS